MAKEQNKNRALHSDADGNPLAGVGSGTGWEFVKAYFPEAEQTIRIASAFFTLTGYKQSRKYVSTHVQIRVLVGREEGWHVEQTIINEIMSELGRCETGLWETVFELVARMKNGQFIIRDAREMQTPFHCKFYISDDKLVWHGSANYTGRGLRVSAEQASISRDPAQIKLFSQWYDTIAENAKDLMGKLIDCLEAWLRLATPFDVYLKTLLLLNNLPDYPINPEALTPSYYQKGIIARALRQAEEYGGALIVVATGLGKTVIGAEIPMRLRTSNGNQHVILVAPQGVHEHWEEQLKGRHVYAEFYNTEVLFRKASNRSHHSVAQLDKSLAKSDDGTIIIIDEAHFYRNQLLAEYSKQQKSRVYKRLLPAVKNGAKIFLFTATAYGTNFQNFNSLLYLLPHRQPNMIDSDGAWEAHSADDFARLPVVTTLGLPHVLKMARDRGDIDENNRTFILFAGQRRYLPRRLKLHSLHYKMLLQQEIQPIFDDKIFDQQFRSPQPWYDDNTLSVRRTTVDAGYNASLLGWLGSPAAFIDVIERNLATQDAQEVTSQLSFWGQDIVEKHGQQPQQRTSTEPVQAQDSKTPLYKSSQQRKSVLEPLLTKLIDAVKNQDDEKLLRLRDILTERCVNIKGKAIVFVERHLTALYLSKELACIFGEAVNIGCTVEPYESGGRLKADYLRSELRKCFSPRSHNYLTDAEYDILICTDADGVGHNLQDADTVVNYDPPSGADVLFQRAGRVLRMTPDPDRVVHFYTLVPSIVCEEANQSRVQDDVKSIFNRMTHRHDKSKRILGSGVMSGEKDFEVNLDSDVDMEELTRDSEFLHDIGGLGAASIMSHTAVLEQHREKAERLPEHLLSARNYSQSKHRVFVLLLHKGIYRPLLLDLSNRRIEKRDDLAILDLIACTELEPRAPVNPADVERLANRAVQTWCMQESIPVEEVTKVCALHLVPVSEIGGVSDILSEIQKEEDRVDA